MSQLNNDVETKSTSKESSYLDKNKVNNDNSSADEDENCLESQSPKASKKRGRNKTYEILKKFDSNVDLKSATDEMNQLGWVKRKVSGKKCLFRCKRECPKVMHIEFGVDGLIAYQSTCEHKHEKNKYNLPSSTVNLVKECFAKNQTKPSAIQKIILYFKKIDTRCKKSWVHIFFNHCDPFLKI